MHFEPAFISCWFFSADKAGENAIGSTFHKAIRRLSLVAVKATTCFQVPSRSLVVNQKAFLAVALGSDGIQEIINLLKRWQIFESDQT